MAKMVLLASYLNVAGTDLTANTSKIELEIDVNDQDVTTFASGGWKEVLGGLKSAKLAVTFKTDYAAAAVDELIWGLLGTVVTYEVRPSSSARSTSNPGYTPATC
jgi:predicted secreted protein